MGVLDKLMFWKKETVELDYEVSGCFTLPTDGTTEDLTGLAADGVEQAADHLTEGQAPEQI